MSMYKNTRAIFEYLKIVAAERRTVTYGEIENRFKGSVARSLGALELDEILKSCTAQGLPHLSALVVTKKFGRPGDGYRPNGHAVNDAEFKIIKRDVFGHPWSDESL